MKHLCRPRAKFIGARPEFVHLSFRSACLQESPFIHVMKGLFHKTNSNASAGAETDAVISFIPDRLWADLRSNESQQGAADCIWFGLLKHLAQEQVP
jgi:hypothetical protein